MRRDSSAVDGIRNQLQRHGMPIEHVMLRLITVALETIVAGTFAGAVLAAVFRGLHDILPTLEGLLNEAGAPRSLIVEDDFLCHWSLLVCKPTPRNTDIGQLKIQRFAKATLQRVGERFH